MVRATVLTPLLVAQIKMYDKLQFVVQAGITLHREILLNSLLNRFPLKRQTEVYRTLLLGPAIDQSAAILKLLLDVLGLHYQTFKLGKIIWFADGFPDLCDERLK